MNPRGVLVHRVRLVVTHESGHESVDYWCNGSTNGDGVNLTDDPGERLLCAKCEALAVASGEKSVKELVGRHVHVGEMRPHRLCCKSN